MAIKPIEAIPTKKIERTQRGQIREDFAEAMRNRIEIFELEDEIYNYNNLPVAIKDSIDWMQRSVTNRVWRKLNKENPNSTPVNWSDFNGKTDRMYEVHTVRGEDRRHVYVKLKSFDIEEWATELYYAKQKAKGGDEE